MAYTAPTFVNNNTPAINAQNLNDLAGAVQLLTVPNGGTGRNNLYAGSILLGNGTDPVLRLSGTGAVYATTYGSPTFGTLPVSCGGTGATTMEQLKSSMGLTNAGFVAQASPPSDTSVLWINTTNNTMNYFNGTNWIPIVGVYGSAG